MYNTVEPLSNQDTNGAEKVSLLVRCPHFRFQRLKCMQEWYLGWEKVSCLERCPQFRSVLIEREVPLSCNHGDIKSSNQNNRGHIPVKNE